MSLGDDGLQDGQAVVVVITALQSEQPLREEFLDRRPQAAVTRRLAVGAVGRRRVQHNEFPGLGGVPS